MPVTSKKDAGSAVVREAFGAPLSQQGRGFYVTLELLAICWGTYHGELGDVFPALPPGAPLRYAQRSHDFARRWMAGENLTEEDRTNVRGEAAEETLRTLLVSLRVPIPHRRVMPSWGNQHLYPYIGELVHYDALQRRTRISMERNTYRGGGGLAHKMLRTDDEPDRLEANRAGMRVLVGEDEGALGRLAKALATHDTAKDEGEFTDRTESEAVVHEGAAWVDHLRNGVRNITSRPATPRSKQVELLMHWVPYCIARHQMERAADVLDRPRPHFPIAVDPDSSSLRQAGRRQLDAARASVHACLETVASELAGESEGQDSEHFRSLLDGGSWIDGPQQFLTGTLATVGALNAHAGRRHFTVSLPLIEAIVHAVLEPWQDMPYERFCEHVLFDDLGLVVDPSSGAKVRLTDDIDHGELARNSEFLAEELKGLGLLDEYSDATRMVHAEVSK